MGDPNQDLLRQLGLDPSGPPPRAPSTALSVEDWSAGAAGLARKREADPRATRDKGVDSRATTKRGVDSKGDRTDVNEEFLKTIGLHPAAPKRTSVLASRDMFGAVPPVLPAAVTREQRQRAERLRDAEVTPPRSTRERIEQAAVAEGVPLPIFRRPLTDFEIRLRTQNKVQLNHPERGIPTEPFAATTFTPLADPDTGATIGYAKSGADSLICDLNGNILQWGDAPSTPSAIQPDDLVLIGSTLVKGGGKLLAQGALIARRIGTRVSGRTVTRLRAVAASLMVGAAEPAPVVGGRLGARAIATAEGKIGTEALLEAESAGKRLLPIPGATEIRVTPAEYEAALRHTFPSHALDPITQTVERIGQRAARRAAADPRFIAAIQQRNFTLAGTLFHSAAATEARALPANALPSGWLLEAERTLQSRLGGSRADILLRGPNGQVIEFDWKTSGISALSTSSRREMVRHAGHIATNLGGTLAVQESRSWINFVREVRPDLFR